MTVSVFSARQLHNFAPSSLNSDNAAGIKERLAAALSAKLYISISSVLLSHCTHFWPPAEWLCICSNYPHGFARTSDILSEILKLPKPTNCSFVIDNMAFCQQNEPFFLNFEWNSVNNIESSCKGVDATLPIYLRYLLKVAFNYWIPLSLNIHVKNLNRKIKGW